MFSHILEEVFLTPAGEQRHGGPVQGPLVIGGQHRGLVTGGVAVANLSDPQAVAQLSASLGQR